MAELKRAVPDHTALYRRQKTLAVQIPYRRTQGPLHLRVDSTGIMFQGNDEGQACKRAVRHRTESLSNRMLRLRIAHKILSARQKCKYLIRLGK